MRRPRFHAEKFDPPMPPPGSLGSPPTKGGSVIHIELTDLETEAAVMVLGSPAGFLAPEKLDHARGRVLKKMLGALDDQNAAKESPR